MRLLLITLAGLLAAPGAVHAINCAAVPQAMPVRARVLAPIAPELSPPGNVPGARSGVLSQAYDEAQSVDQVLLRLRIEGCQDVAKAMPAPSVINPDDPAAYKPKTEFDNTPWRFDMSQNGKRMTADEFSAWMKARGVRVARGAGAPAVPATAATPPASAAVAPAPAIPSAAQGMPPGILPTQVAPPTPAPTPPASSEIPPTP